MDDVSVCVSVSVSVSCVLCLYRCVRHDVHPSIRVHWTEVLTCVHVCAVFLFLLLRSTKCGKLISAMQSTRSNRQNPASEHVLGPAWGKDSGELREAGAMLCGSLAFCLCFRMCCTVVTCLCGPLHSIQILVEETIECNTLSRLCFVRWGCCVIQHGRSTRPDWDLNLRMGRVRSVFFWCGHHRCAPLPGGVLVPGLLSTHAWMVVCPVDVARKLVGQVPAISSDFMGGSLAASRPTG
jgi:hypothetical protein